MSHSQDAYFAQFLTDTTRPPDAIIAPADEQALLDLALGQPVGADIHKRYEYTEYHQQDAFSSSFEGHEERMRYHEQRIAGHN